MNPLFDIGKSTKSSVIVNDNVWMKFLTPLHAIYTRENFINYIIWMDVSKPFGIGMVAFPILIMLYK